MQRGSIPTRSTPATWLNHQLRLRGAHHERCREMRLRVLQQLASQLRARTVVASGCTKPRGVLRTPGPEMPR